MRFYARIVTVGDPSGYSGVPIPPGLDGYDSVENAIESFLPDDVGLVLIYPGEHLLSRRIAFADYTLDLRGLGDHATDTILTRPSSGPGDVRNQFRPGSNLDTIVENLWIKTAEATSDNGIFFRELATGVVHNTDFVLSKCQVSSFGQAWAVQWFDGVPSGNRFVFRHSLLESSSATFYQPNREITEIVGSILPRGWGSDSGWAELDAVTSPATGYGPDYGEFLIDLSVLWQHHVIGRAIDTRLQPPDRAVIFLWDTPHQFQRIPIEPTGDWSLRLLPGIPLGVYYLTHEGRVAPTIHGPYTIANED